MMKRKYRERTVPPLQRQKVSICSRVTLVAAKDPIQHAASNRETHEEGPDGSWAPSVWRVAWHFVVRLWHKSSNYKKMIRLQKDCQQGE